MQKIVLDYKIFIPFFRKKTTPYWHFPFSKENHITWTASGYNFQSDARSLTFLLILIKTGFLTDEKLERATRLKINDQGVLLIDLFYHKSAVTSVLVASLIQSEEASPPHFFNKH